MADMDSIKPMYPVPVSQSTRTGPRKKAPDDRAVPSHGERDGPGPDDGEDGPTPLIDEYA